MTLMEYLQDYASPKTKEIGMKLIEKELDNIPSEKVRRIAEEHLRDIENGQRDFRLLKEQSDCLNAEIRTGNTVRKI